MLRRAVVAGLTSALLVGTGVVVSSAAQASPSPTGITYMNERVCATPALGNAACDAVRRVPVKASGHGHGPSAGGSSPPPVSYGASQLQQAYNLTSASTSDGGGHTVAIVDAYDDPNAAGDLATYRSAEGLPQIANCSVSGTTLSLPAGVAGGPCFAKVDQSGIQGSYPTASSSWAQEVSLDLDMVSAICPNCTIVLVEANSNTLANLGQAVDTAATFGPAAIGNSYGGSEFSGEQSYPYSGTSATGVDGYYDHPGIAVTAATGDSGYGVEFPAAASTVIAVGGTSLRQATNGSWSETVWSGTGSGCSAYVPKPAWQSDPGCPNRTVADVAADADPSTGVSVYDSYGQNGWLVFGGTSVSTEIVAGVYGLVGGGVDNASGLYEHTSGSGTTPIGFGSANGLLRDVISGSNGSCTGHGHNVDSSLAYLCNGETGYDGPTGMGTPQGVSAF